MDRNEKIKKKFSKKAGLNQENWNAIKETLYLNSITNMTSSIQKNMNSPDNEFNKTVKW